MNGSCTLCPAGTYSILYGSSGACDPCPAGTYSAEGASACTACPVGTYSGNGGNGSCTPCPAGTSSNEGASTCTTCPAGQKWFPGFPSCFASEIFDGQLFGIQSLYTNQYLTADPYGYPTAQAKISNLRGTNVTIPLRQGCSSLYNSYEWFTYNSTTMQIYNPATNLCLDDLGHGYSATPSTSDTLAFTLCSSSKTQQFAYFPSSKYILNPNNPYDKCLDGNNQYPEVFLWQCPYGGLNHQWEVVLSCMPGILVLY